MNENQPELNSVEEPQVRLSELEEGVRLPDEKPQRNRRRKVLLMLLALLLLVVVTGIGGWFLLRGERVDLRANKKLPEKIASGKDIKQAAFDSISGSLTEPVKAPASSGTGSLDSTQQLSASAITRDEKVSVPIQPGIATTLAAPPEALAAGAAASGSIQQRNNDIAVKGASGSSATLASVSATKASATQSVRFAPAPQKAASVRDGSDLPLKASVTGRVEQSDQINSSTRLVKRTAAPNFGAMLPVRLMGVLYTLRTGTLVRLELARDLKAGNWQLRRGTVFIGQSLGGELDRAYLQIKGFIDPDTQTFTKLEGEVLGNDGGAGLRGRQRRISPTWVRVLDRTAEAGVQIATGVLNRRSSSVVIAADPYGTYRSASGADGLRSDQNRTFVEVAAGTSGFVMVTTLPEATSDSHLAKAGAHEESPTDEELAELMAEADPARIRVALPRMNPELQRVAQMVLKEIEAEKP
ncbi:MAG: hypothetical protein JNJ50_32720 [Acidobacteria bacterium]|nr:hypothetical protein [Acidobacteriota bacterium]